jgi:site-specific DNA-methyltransferase (adenine-specific)
MSKIELHLGDCLQEMKKLADKSIDLVLCDPPYGTTACKWDTVIPLEPMWEQLKRITKPNGAIVMTATQPFTTTLIASNMKMFKYCWVWEKDNASNFFAAKFQPLNNTEDVIVFSGGGCNNGAKSPVPYNPQGINSVDIDCVNGENVGGELGKAHKTSMRAGRRYKQTQTGYPFKIIKFKRDSNKIHPTQKPVALGQYLIRTYTNTGEVVLDFTAGSGSFGVAAVLEGRGFIGIEKEQKYYDIMVDRIKKAQEEVASKLF